MRRTAARGGGLEKGKATWLAEASWLRLDGSASHEEKSSPPTPCMFPR